MGTITISWLIMEKTTSIRRLKLLSLFMYVIILTCDFSDFDEEMVVSLAILTLNDLDNDS